MEDIVFKEFYGPTKRKRLYVQTQNKCIKLVESQASERFTSLSTFFRDVFLPKGYPDSVSDDYFQYQVWDTVQAFASSITSTLAIQAVLKGVGVGDEHATVLAATLTWLMKDGTGMLGRIMFTWIQGSYLDCDCKRWRLFADILNDFAILIDICAPIFNAYFTLIVCIAGVCRSIVGVAGGATRAAVTQHQARRHNMADVSAKDGSQETLVNLAALLCNLALVPIVAERQWLVWILFICFTSLHIQANYFAVKSLCMQSFNQTRMHIAAQMFLSHESERFPSVKEVNQREPVLWRMKRKFLVNLGASISRFHTDLRRLQMMQMVFSRDQFLLNLNIHTASIDIVLCKGASNTDMMKAFLNAELLECASIRPVPPPLQPLATALSQNDEHSALQLSRELNERLFPTFIIQAQSAGWKTDQVMLNADEWRFQLNRML